MKRILSIMLVLVLVFAVGCQPKEATSTEPTKTETVKIVDNDNLKPEDVKEITMGLVTDTGGIDDKSFNQGTYEGLKAYQEKYLPEKKDNLSYLQSITDADYIPNLTQFADAKKDLIVAPGFLFEQAIAEIAKTFPEQKILFLDAVVDAPNVANAVFAEHEGSYLVGLAAGLKAKEAGKTKVGFIGGADFDLIQKFEAGFEQGVKAVDPNFEVMIDYASGFDKAEEGQTIAAKMYDAGAYIIYHAAGSTGNGVIKEAKDRANNGQDVWVIGVDKDQYAEGMLKDGQKSAVLTSMIKRVDQASYDIAKMVAKGEFKGGTYVFSLANNGVDIPSVNPNLKPEWVEQINKYKADVIAGTIKIDPVPTRKK
ncbi:BMP family lipoprotein [Guggenheimella bovis]